MKLCRILLSPFKPFIERKPVYPLRILEDLSDSAYPPEFRRIPVYPKRPTVKVDSEPRRKIDYRGPETVHNTLLYGHYGIQAMDGGELKSGHFEMMRLGINKRLEDNRMFAQYRVPPPFKPVSKRSQGSRMGGGKGDTNHFVTPVRKGRIILELGGNLYWQEAYSMLTKIVKGLPFPARFVSKELFETEEKISEYIKKNDINPMSINLDNIMKNNYAGCKNFLSPWIHVWKNPSYYVK